MATLSPIRSSLPVANIKSMIIDEPGRVRHPMDAGRSRSEKILNITVKTTSITTADNKELSGQDTIFASIPNFNFNDYIRVAVIQSLDADFTAVLQSIGKDVTKYIGPLNNWRGNDKFNDLIYSNILKGKGKTKDDISVFKSTFMKIKTKKLFDNIESPILQMTDDVGKQIKSIPSDFNFTVPAFNPVHLAYFIFSYVDFDLMASELNKIRVSCDRESDAVDLGLKGSDFATIGDFSAEMKHDILFKDGVVSSRSFFYHTPNGDVWTGVKHKMPDGRFMTGPTHAIDSLYLQTRETRNVKVQDFRISEGVATIKVMSDFQDEEQTVRNILRNLQPKERSLNPNNNVKDSYISELFLSTGVRKSGKFMFLINMDDLMTNNSLFGKLIKTDSLSLRGEVFKNSSIKSLKIYRHTVKKVVGTNELGGSVDKYLRQNSAPTLVANSLQKPGKTFLEPTTDIMEEVEMSFSDAGIRAFNVTDRNFTAADRSQYQYTLEIHVVDQTVDYLRGEVDKLRGLLDTLENYNSDMLNSAVRTPQDWNTPGSTVMTRTRAIGGFDQRFGNLTPNFAKKMKDKYSNNLQSGIRSFIELLKIFSTPGEFSQVAETNLDNFLNLITNPNTTNPTNVASFIRLLQDSVAKISSFIQENVRMTQPSENRPKYLIGGGDNVMSMPGGIEIEKRFNHILDLSMHGKGGYDYLSKSTGESSQDASNQVGLRTLGGVQYRQRIIREILKYFTSASPDLTQGMTSRGTAFAGGDAVQTTGFSFLSPAIIRFDELPIDILNGDRIDNALLMKFVESKIVSNKVQSMSSGAPPPLDSSFRKNSFLASRQNTRAQQIAPTEQQAFLSQQYNLISTVPKVIPLSENGYQGAAPAPVEQSSLDGSESSIVVLPSNQPASFMERIFKRSIKKPGTVEEKNIDLYDLTHEENFLRGVEQSRVSRLPNQLKALFISVTTGNGGGVKFRPLVRKNLFEDPDRSASSTLKYKLLTEVQYLDSFTTTSMSNRKKLLMTAPNWRRMDASVFSKNTGKKVICRLRKYEISQWGIVRPPLLDTLIYDEYFIIQPDAPVTGVNLEQTAGSTLVDPVREALAAAGWGLSEEEFSMLTEFGTAYLPNTDEPLQSDLLSQMAARLGLFRESLFPNPAAAAANTNTPTPLVCGENEEISTHDQYGNPRNAAICQEIAMLSQEDTNSELEADPPPNAPLPPGSQLGKLGALREDLNLINQQIQDQTTLLNDYTISRDTAKATMDSETPKFSEGHAQAGEDNPLWVTAQQTFTAANTNIAGATGQLQQLRTQKAIKLQEIQAEAATVQSNIITAQVQSGVYGDVACDLPPQAEIPADSPYETSEDIDRAYTDALIKIMGSAWTVDDLGEMSNLNDEQKQAFLDAMISGETYEGASIIGFGDDEQTAAAISTTLAAAQERANSKYSDGTENNQMRMDQFMSYMSPADAQEFQDLLSELEGSGILGEIASADLQGDVSDLVMEAIDACGGSRLLETQNAPQIIVDTANARAAGWNSAIEDMLDRRPTDSDEMNNATRTAFDSPSSDVNARFRDGTMTYSEMKQLFQIIVLGLGHSTHKMNGESVSSVDGVWSQIKKSITDETSLTYEGPDFSGGDITISMTPDVDIGSHSTNFTSFLGYDIGQPRRDAFFWLIKDAIMGYLGTYAPDMFSPSSGNYMNIAPNMTRMEEVYNALLSVYSGFVEKNIDVGTDYE